MWKLGGGEDFLPLDELRAGEGGWWVVSWVTGLRSSVYPKNNGKPGKALSWGAAGSALSFQKILQAALQRMRGKRHERTEGTTWEALVIHEQVDAWPWPILQGTGHWALGTGSWDSPSCWPKQTRRPDL